MKSERRTSTVGSAAQSVTIERVDSRAGHSSRQDDRRNEGATQEREDLEAVRV